MHQIEADVNPRSEGTFSVWNDTSICMSVPMCDIKGVMSPHSLIPLNVRPIKP